MIMKMTAMLHKYHTAVLSSYFRKHMGTVDNNFVLHGVIKHLLNIKKKWYAVFVDFTVAFDYLVRYDFW